MTAHPLRRVLAALSMLALVAGCGTDAGDARATLNLVPSLFRSPPPPEPLTATQIAEAVRTVQAPLIIAEFERGRSQSLMSLLETNDVHDTYGNVSRQTLTLRRGVVTATRALGSGLMSSDADALIRQIRARQTGSVPYTMRRITPEGVTRVLDFVCVVTPEPGSRRGGFGPVSVTGQQITADCNTDAGTRITNRFLVSPGGEVVSARQWLGEEWGYIQVTAVGRTGFP